MPVYDDVEIKEKFVAFDGTPAAVAGRLINFQTGKFDLRPGHRLWLQEQVVPAIIARSNPWIDIYGFASKKGLDEQFNMTLSKNRATAAKNFISSEMAMKGKSIEGLFKQTMDSAKSIRITKRMNQTITQNGVPPKL